LGWNHLIGFKFAHRDSLRLAPFAALPLARAVREVRSRDRER